VLDFVFGHRHTVYSELSNSLASNQIHCDVQKFASTRLDPKASNIIIVGNASAFLSDLQKNFPNVEVIKITELDLNTALLRKKQQP